MFEGTSHVRAWRTWTAVVCCVKGLVGYTAAGPACANICWLGLTTEEKKLELSLPAGMSQSNTYRNFSSNPPTAQVKGKSPGKRL